MIQIRMRRKVDNQNTITQMQNTRILWESQRRFPG